MTESNQNQDPLCPHCNIRLTQIDLRHGICPNCGQSVHGDRQIDYDAVEPRKFDTSDVLNKSWNAFRAHFGFILALNLVLILLYAGPNYLSAKLPLVSAPYFSVLIIIFNILITLGQIRIFLDIAKGKSGDFTLLVSQYQYFLPYLLGMIAFIIIVAAGFLLLVIPGVIWMLQFQFFSYAIVDEDLGPMEALHRSSELTAGAKGQLFGFVLFLVLINFVGVLAFGIGVFVTYPITQLAMAYIYLDMKANTDELPSEVTDPVISPAEG